VDIHNLRTQSCGYPLSEADKRLGLCLNGGSKVGDALFAHQKLRDTHYYNCGGYGSAQCVDLEITDIPY